MSENACAHLGLTFYQDTRPGIQRRRRGRGFSYVAPDGTFIDCKSTRKRLAALAVPPAYTKVWMSPHENGHLLATGRDTAGRKQYMYHPIWLNHHATEKFDRLPELASGLPRLRRWITRQLARDAVDEHTAMAEALALMDRFSLRVGSRHYTKENGSYGATTLRGRHLQQTTNGVGLRYTAKGGAEVLKLLTGKRLIDRLKRAREAEDGAPLVHWFDDNGRRRSVEPRKLAERFAEVLKLDAQPKDLRTWNGSRAAFLAAVQAENPTIALVADAAAETLHNTQAVARSSYVHPKIVEAVKTDAPPRMQISQGNNGLRAGEAELARFIS